MSGEKKEASTEILAEMRKDIPRVVDANTILRNYADRLESAIKREKASIEADALAVGGIVGAACQKVSSRSKRTRRMETMRFIVKYNFPDTATGLLTTPLLSSLAHSITYSMEVDATCAKDAVEAVLTAHPGVLIRAVSVLKTICRKRENDEQKDN